MHKLTKLNVCKSSQAIHIFSVHILPSDCEPSNFTPASGGEHLSRSLLTILFSANRANMAAVCMPPSESDLQSLHRTDIQQRGLHVMIGSLHSFPPLLVPSFLLPLLGSERDGTHRLRLPQPYCQTAIAASLSLSQPMGYSWQHMILTARQPTRAWQESLQLVLTYSRPHLNIWSFYR